MRNSGTVFSKLHLANIGYSARLDDLKSLCQTLNLAVAIDMPLDRHTGRSRGFAFLTFASSHAARAGLAEITGHDLGGQAIQAQIVGVDL